MAQDGKCGIYGFRTEIAKNQWHKIKSAGFNNPKEYINFIT